MSERKTTEIKLRVSPEEKTSWQLAAEQREVGLSQFIRDCVTESLHAQWNVNVDGLNLVDNAIALLAPEPSVAEVEDSPVAQAVPTSGDVDLVSEAPTTISVGTPVANGVVKIEDIIRHIPTGGVIEVSAEEKPKSWMFEARSGD